MRTSPFKIPELLRQIRTSQYAIPQFQRDFIWRESQVKLLVDSIARNYPIGSLLTISSSAEMKLQSRSLDAAIKLDPYSDMDESSFLDEDSESKINLQYVLDGQQRLTAVARVFLNAHPDKNYYFDLKKMYEFFDSDVDNTSWIIIRKRGKEDPERKDNGRFLRTDIALDQKKTDVYIPEYVEDSGDFPELLGNRSLAREAAAKIKGVFETIRSYEIPIVILDRDAQLDSICRVFETINSTGTRLTVFDLAVAKYFTEKIDIKNLWDESKTKHPILNEFDVDGERVLQILVLWKAKDKGITPETKRSELLGLEKDFINQRWHIAAESLSKTYEWAKSNGARRKTLTNHSIIVSIAAFRIVCSDFVNKPKSSIDIALRRWYFTKITRSSVGTATNYTISQDFQRLVDHAEKDQALDFIDVNLSPEKIMRLNKATDNLYKMTQCIMTMTATQDIWTGKELSSMLVEDHHIFPASMKNKGLKKAELDSLANKLFISQETNRTLGGEIPEKYFEELRLQSENNGILLETQRRLSSCFVPYALQDENFPRRFNYQNFHQFLKDRSELIYQRLKEVLGDSLINRDDNYLEEDDFDDK